MSLQDELREQLLDKAKELVHERTGLDAGALLEQANGFLGHKSLTQEHAEMEDGTGTNVADDRLTENEDDSPSLSAASGPDEDEDEDDEEDEDTDDEEEAPVDSEDDDEEEEVED